jgi:hypothetical protein
MIRATVIQAAAIHVPVVNASARICTRAINGESQRWRWSKEKIMGITIVPHSDAKRRRKTIQNIKGTPKEYSKSRTTTAPAMKPDVPYAVDRGVLSPRDQEMQAEHSRLIREEAEKRYQRQRLKEHDKHMDKRMYQRRKKYK